MSIEIVNSLATTSYKGKGECGFNFHFLVHEAGAIREKLCYEYPYTEKYTDPGKKPECAKCFGDICNAIAKEVPKVGKKFNANQLGAVVR